MLRSGLPRMLEIENAEHFGVVGAAALEVEMICGRWRLGLKVSDLAGEASSSLESSEALESLIFRGLNAPVCYLMFDAAIEGLSRNA